MIPWPFSFFEYTVLPAQEHASQAALARPHTGRSERSGEPRGYVQFTYVGFAFFLFSRVSKGRESHRKRIYIHAMFIK